MNSGEASWNLLNTKRYRSFGTRTLTFLISINHEELNIAIDDDDDDDDGFTMLMAKIKKPTIHRNANSGFSQIVELADKK